jgi:hypothetical protein
MVALTTLTPDARKVFGEHLNHVVQRCHQVPASPVQAVRRDA